MRARRILFIEDDFICSLNTCEVLRDYGFTVVAVHCAAAAREAILSQADLAALVTDIDLGAGDDGFGVARQARAVYPHLPVVYVSGTAADRVSVEGVPGAEFIAKPFDPQQIIAALCRVIRLEAA